MGTSPEGTSTRSCERRNPVWIRKHSQLAPGEQVTQIHLLGELAAEQSLSGLFVTEAATRAATTFRAALQMHAA